MQNIPTVPAKSIVYRVGNANTLSWLDYSMNIYRGCNHGCIYCDSRSDCFRNTDFDTVKVKENALQIVRDDLRRKVKLGVVHTGAMSDPYNSLEAELKLSRNALELINAFGFGTSIATKSSLVTRDIDVLCDIKSHAPVMVSFSVIAACDELCKKIEPNVSVTSERFEALSLLASAGIFCGVYLNPVLPFLTDTTENILQILRMAKDAGAKYVHTYMSMTLRPGSREHYFAQLDNHFPDIRQKHAKRYGMRKYNQSPNEKKLWDVFAAECERLGLLYDMNAIVFANRTGYDDRQLTL